jgi:hypothetical protein
MIHTGFDAHNVNWISDCISIVSYVVLINGSPFPFFHPRRGLMQDRPLSPLLFLLVSEGLSRILRKLKDEGSLKGVKVAKDLNSAQLHFVDNVILFGNGTVREARAIGEALQNK